MHVIARRFWEEPAVCIGLLTSLAMLVLKILVGDPWDTATIAGVAAPLLSALGIRDFVSPAAGPSGPDSERAGPGAPEESPGPAEHDA